MTTVVALALGLVGAGQPNIVYVMADDLGYGELGCYGQAKIATPNIDRLAAEGVRMTRFYSASPVCAPTRCSLMTGLHQGHAPIRGNKEQGDFSLNGKEGQFPLPSSTTTLAEVLRAAGYRTGIVGKWALGGVEPGQNPLDHGFDFFYGYLCQRRAHNFYPAYLWRGRQPEVLAGNRAYEAHQRIAEPLTRESEYAARYGGTDYAPARMLAACREFIAESKGRPFFLYVASNLPHAALQAPQERIDRYPRAWDPQPYLGEKGYLPTPRPRATYAAMIAYLDHTVGEIRRALEEAGRSHDTVILFTSDNGATFNGGVDTAFFASNGGLRGQKMSLYEGGIRVPMVAWWPGKIPAGNTSDAVAMAYDSFATLAEIAGARAPKRDGISYLPALLGRPMPDRPFVYTEYPEAASMQAVFMGRFKAIRPNLSRDPDRLELYDVAGDPGETRDLAGERPDLVRRARQIMRREHTRNADFLLPGVDTPAKG